MSGQRNGLRVLHDDRHLLAVDKPAGTPTTPDANAPGSSLVERLAQDGDGAAEAFFSGQQPLFDACSGVEILARSEAAQSELDNLLEERRITRTYVALVAGNMTAVGVIHLPVTLVGADGEPRKVQARTRYERLARLPDLTLARLRPDRNSGEQLVHHLRSIGHPIGGDDRGTESFNLWLQAMTGEERLLLHCASTELRHPATDEALALVAPLPEDFWAALRRLGFSDDLLRELALPPEPGDLPPVADPPPELPDAELFPGMWSGEIAQRRRRTDS